MYANSFKNCDIFKTKWKTSAGQQLQQNGTPICRRKQYRSKYYFGKSGENDRIANTLYPKVKTSSSQSRLISSNLGSIQNKRRLWFVVVIIFIQNYQVYTFSLVASSKKEGRRRFFIKFTHPL